MPDKATRRDHLERSGADGAGAGGGGLLGAFDGAAPGSPGGGGGGGGGGERPSSLSKARQVRRDVQEESGVGALLAGGAPARGGGGVGALSGRALHPARVAAVWGESAPDRRADVLPVGVAEKAAAAGVDPRTLVQRVALHESRRARAVAPFATTD